MGKDTLSDLLRSVRLKGALFFHVECKDPWVTEAPAAGAIAPAVLPASEHVMEYHVVLEGGCWAGLIGEKQIRLEQGDIFVLPHGDAHVLSSKSGMRASAAMERFFQRARAGAGRCRRACPGRRAAGGAGAAGRGRAKDRPTGRCA